MIETVRPCLDPSTTSNEKELAPHIWRKQTAEAGQFVEIVLPPLELNDLITECEQTFPAYAVQVLDALAKHDPTALRPDQRLTPELMKGLFYTQLLGTLLTRHHVWEEQAMPVLSGLLGGSRTGIWQNLHTPTLCFAERH